MAGGPKQIKGENKGRQSFVILRLLELLFCEVLGSFDFHSIASNVFWILALAGEL